MAENGVIVRTIPQNVIKNAMCWHHFKNDITDKQIDLMDT